MFTAPTLRESGTVLPPSPITNAHSGHLGPVTPGSLSSSGSRGPSVTPASSPVQGNRPAYVQHSDDDSDYDTDSEESTDEECHSLEADGLDYVLAEEKRQQMVRLLKMHPRQRTRSAKLRSSTQLEGQVKQLERHLMDHRAEPVCEMDTLRKDAGRMWTVRAQERLKQRANRAL